MSCHQIDDDNEQWLDRRRLLLCCCHWRHGTWFLCQQTDDGGGNGPGVTWMEMANDGLIVVRRCHVADGEVAPLVAYCSWWRGEAASFLLQLVTWHGGVILAVLGMPWPSTVVGDVGGWWWPLVTVAWMMVVVVEEEVVVDDAQIERRQMLTLNLGIVDSIPLIPGLFLPCDSQNHSGGMWIPFHIPPE